VDVDLFSKKARLVVPLKKVRTREEVDFQWSRVVVSAGFPMSFFDNKEVPKAVLMTTECAENYIRTKPGRVKNPRCRTAPFSLRNVSQNSTSSLITRTCGGKKEKRNGL
jgi:hypothetical protein